MQKIEQLEIRVEEQEEEIQRISDVEGVANYLWAKEVEKNIDFKRRYQYLLGNMTIQDQRNYNPGNHTNDIMDDIAGEDLGRPDNVAVNKRDVNVPKKELFDVTAVKGFAAISSWKCY